MKLEQIEVPIDSETLKAAAGSLMGRFKVSSQLRELEKHMAKYKCSVIQIADKTSVYPRLILKADEEGITHNSIVRAYNEFWDIVALRDAEEIKRES